MLSLADFWGFINDDRPYELSKEQRECIMASHRFLNNFAGDKVIYGINTGFGPMAPYRISAEDQTGLQYNLIRSHASGMGPALSETYVKAVMICRLNSLALGFSGVSLGVAEQLEKYIQLGIYPYIPEHGSVGASGDLVQLAHLALGLIGEGDGVYKGKTAGMAAILAQAGLNPVELKLRDGLALINGTSCMSGIGLLNVAESQRLLSWALVMGSILCEIAESYSDPVSAELNQVKQHRGQNTVAAIMREYLTGSGRMRKREEHLFNGTVSSTHILNEKVQEYYSLRCIPQVAGPVYDMLEAARECLVNEINSVNDNPVIDEANGNVFHGGNFHGDYVAFEMDKLKIGMTKLSMLMERQLNYLLNHKLNERFAPFLNPGKLGYNFGMQGMQYTATSTTAENQVLSNPMYVHSIPNNGDNQDIVSMGTNAALMSRTVVHNGFQVASILALAVAQAMDMEPHRERYSPVAQKFYQWVRSHSAMIDDDRSVSAEIRNMAAAMRAEDFLAN